MPRYSGKNQTSLKVDMPWELRLRFERACEMAGLIDPDLRGLSYSSWFRTFLEEFATQLEELVAEAGMTLPPLKEIA